MTEQEAKTKWCPFAHMILMHSSSGNRSIPGTAYAPEYERACRCIASACMAWRWLHPSFEPPEGYCGLALL